jgi:AmmeMemoRadiSam system protein A
MREMPERGDIVLRIAREAIAHALGADAPPRLPQAPWLDAPGCSFVTLRRDGELRGCIGSLEAHRPLGEDIAGNAVAAALRDGRFAPVTAGELASLEVEVSLLGPSEPIDCVDELDAIGKLRPGVDGVVIAFGSKHATFLPQVWESLPDASLFLRELKRKAGLPADFWHPELRLSRYGVEKHRREDAKDE